MTQVDYPHRTGAGDPSTTIEDPGRVNFVTDELGLELIPAECKAYIFGGNAVMQANVGDRFHQSGSRNPAHLFLFKAASSAWYPSTSEATSLQPTQKLQ